MPSEVWSDEGYEHYEHTYLNEEHDCGKPCCPGYARAAIHRNMALWHTASLADSSHSNSCNMHREANPSRGILWFGDAGSNALRSGAGAFVKRTLPRPEPMKLSDTTQRNLDRTYRATAGASRVTRSTLNSVHNVIAHLVEKKDGKAGETTGQRLRQEAGSAYNTLMDVSGPALNKLKAKAGYGTTPAVNQHGTTAAVGNDGKPPLPTSERPPLPTSEKPPLPPRSGEKPPAYDTSGAGAGYAYDKKDPAGPNAGVDATGEYVRTGDSGTVTPTGKKRPLLNRSMLAVDTLLSSLEAATSQLLSSGTSAASAMATHRYGAEAGEAVAKVGGSARNAVLVYVDVRGMGRRAILKSTAKGYVKARLRSGEKVELKGPQAGQQGQAAAQIGGAQQGQGAQGGNGLYGSEKQDIVVDVPQMKN